MAPRNADPDSEEVFQVYLRAKQAADDNVRGRDLDWTIVPPGRLVDDVPTGNVQIGDLEHGPVTRGDVAHVLAEVIEADNSDREDLRRAQRWRPPRSSRRSP